jgi:hypothetical protein
MGVMPELPDGAAAVPNRQLGASRPDLAVPGQLSGLIPKALSYLLHLLRIERRPWAIVTGAAFGLALTVGHVVGGVSGLIDGYERFVKTWFGNKEAIREQSSSNNPDDQLSSHARALANELRAEFTRARDTLEQTGNADFSRVEEGLTSLRRIDGQIGHIWYFAGEIKRITNPGMFTPKSCLKTLPRGGQIPDFYHQNFYRYLEIASSLPEHETGSDAGSEVCYQKPGGFCIQRTAWIHHLLANDMYQMATASKGNDVERTARLEQAEKHAREARRYRSPDGIEGFVQCIGTTVLEQKIEAQLRGIVKRK